MEVKGVIPKKIRTQGAFSDQYFDQFSFYYSQDEDQRRVTIPISEIKKEKSIGVILEPLAQILQSRNEAQDEIEYKKLKNLENLLEQCLVLDPDDRITPELALKHPFFKIN